MTAHLEMHLEQLLSESLESVRQRQRETLGRMIGGEETDFVLFGAGRLGRRVLSVLTEAGMRPLAFVDNNPALWGREVEGVEVFSPEALARKMAGNLPAVIDSVGDVRLGGHHLAARMEPLRQLGFSRIAVFGHLAWRFAEQLLPFQCVDLPEKLILAREQILQAFRLLGDDASRQVFVAHVEWRLTLDYGVLPCAADVAIYFDDRFSSRSDDEVLYDIGAFNGDSILGYLESGRRYREIHSFEPSAGNFELLQANIDKLSLAGQGGLHGHMQAVGDYEGLIAIEAAGGHTLKVGEGDERVPVTTLDALAERLTPPSFIKVDIEGFEPQCLVGGRRLISERHPLLAVCAYHEQDHLWSLLLQVWEYRPDYRFMLGQHDFDRAWDIVLYAVPQSRLPREASDER